MNDNNKLPSSSDLREIFELAYGEYGVHQLTGALYQNVSNDVIQRLFTSALEKIGADMPPLPKG
jgi:hypothetical protein